jgi:hypothetical protein
MRVIYCDSCTHPIDVTGKTDVYIWFSVRHVKGKPRNLIICAKCATAFLTVEGAAERIKRYSLQPID